jgi:hypothetical protein
MVHLLGIRHHGAGSAKSVRKALEKIKPDLILLEGTLEGDELLEYLAHPDLKPPVAMLIYNPKDLGQAVYYPFTEFSPEWQTVKYAIKEEVPVWNFDLPQAHRFALMPSSEKPDGLLPKTMEELGYGETQATEKVDYDEVRLDPLGYMARLAGYEDGERWWEVTFEQYDGEPELVFESIFKIMQALREDMAHEPSPDGIMEAMREAYMRKCLRKAVKQYKNIAVVCGAWHTPALDLEAHPVKADNALLKGLPKVKTAATWIPWTYERIAKSSGYGAGVISPAWYKLLFFKPENAVIEWMTEVARLFREEDLDASSAHVIEAVRLANTLAALRGLQLPGITELFEAAKTIFTSGYDSPFELIEKRLIIGDEMGEVPAEIPAVPLQQDIEASIKTLKLTKYKTSEGLWLKSTKARPKGGLDLRQDFDREQSQFLHRLQLLSIPWGQEEMATGRERSTKNEYWYLKWKPEFVLQMIEAGMWGNTVELAAANCALRSAKEANSLVQLTDILDQVIKSNLPIVMDALVSILRNMAALTKDVQHLMQALPTMVNILRYGDVRQTDLSMLETMLDELVPRIAVGLPSAAASLDDDATQKMFEAVVSTHRALTLLHDQDYLQLWYDTLETLSDSSAVHGKLQGISTRLLFDSQILDLDATATNMSYALSHAAEVQTAAGWIEGFLYGSGLLLIHNPGLWKIVDDWLSSLKDSNFQELLPLLRRTFSAFSQAEREKMLHLAKNGPSALHKNNENKSWNRDRMQALVPTLKALLGYE